MAIAFDPPNSNSTSPYHPCSEASLINSNVNDLVSTASTEEVPALMKEVDGGYVIANYYYFWNLNSYYPTNSIGECSWVVATMYLTYLNAFYYQTIFEEYIIRPIFLSHSHNYLYVNSNTSTAYCTCGDSVYTQPYYHKHLMTLTGTRKHKRFVCSICNFTKVQ